MLSINVRLTLIALIPLPFVSVSVRYFGTRHPHAIRADPGPARRPQRDRAGGAGRASASSGRTARKRPSSSGSRAANEEYLRRNRGLIRLQGLFYPSMTFFLGLGGAHRPVAGQPRRDPRTDDRRRVRRVQRLSRDVELADDCVRLGDEPAAARPGLVEADARDPRHARRRSSIRPAPRRRSRWPAIRGAIEFRHLTFAYGDRPVLARHLARHRRRADAWPSSGRPAAASRRSLSLLPRLHDPPPGTVFVDGSTCARCRWRCCAAPSAWCRRSRSSSRRPSRRTSRSACRIATKWRTFWRSRRSRGWTRTSTPFLTRGKRWWGSAG